MAEKTYEQKYAEQEKICNEKIAIIEPLLRDRSKKYDAGTRFYEDITILCGPGMCEHNHFIENRKDVYDRWKNGEVSIFNAKWAGVAFVIEYKKTMDARGILPRREPSNAFMVYEHKTLPLPLNVAVAVKDLYQAQEYRSALWGCINNQHGRWGK